MVIPYDIWYEASTLGMSLIINSAIFNSMHMYIRNSFASSAVYIQVQQNSKIKIAK